jgi:ribosome biogenesis SPOUT family RNA methylase Rps3
MAGSRIVRDAQPLANCYVINALHTPHVGPKQGLVDVAVYVASVSSGSSRLDEVDMEQDEGFMNQLMAEWPLEGEQQLAEGVRTPSDECSR